MNFIWIMKLGAWFVETALPFLEKNWKQIIFTGLLIWVIICSLTHCNSRPAVRTGNGPDTLSVVVDTTFKYDSLRVKTLIASAIEDYKRKNPIPKWTPPSVDFEGAENLADSLKEYKTALEWCIASLNDCDSTYREDLAVRTYIDTTRDESDSIEVVSTIVAEGKLLTEPRFDIRLLYGMPTINKTITLIDTVYIGPYRGIYLEGGAGPEFATPDTWIGVRGEAGAGYTDLKGWSYGAEAQYSTMNQWAVLGKIRKTFLLKRLK